MAEDDVTMNVKGLDQILKALKGRLPVARVGILGSQARSGSKGITNATVGAAHEFGTSKMPQRSFLRVPIAEHLDKKLESSGALDKDVLNEVVKSGNVLPWVTKVAALAEGIVLEAFDTGGFGKWPKWKGDYSNNTGNILVDTQQLRNSISYDVVGS